MFKQSDKVPLHPLSLKRPGTVEEAGGLAYSYIKLFKIHLKWRMKTARWGRRVWRQPSVLFTFYCEHLLLGYCGNKEERRSPAARTSDPTKDRPPDHVHQRQSPATLLYNIYPDNLLLIYLSMHLLYRTLWVWKLSLYERRLSAIGNQICPNVD